MGYVYRNASHLKTTCFVGSDLCLKTGIHVKERIGKDFWSGMEPEKEIFIRLLVKIMTQDSLVSRE